MIETLRHYHAGPHYSLEYPVTGSRFTRECIARTQSKIAFLVQSPVVQSHISAELAYQGPQRVNSFQYDTATSRRFSVKEMIEAADDPVEIAHLTPSSVTTMYLRRNEFGHVEVWLAEHPEAKVIVKTNVFADIITMPNQAAAEALEAAGD